MRVGCRAISQIRTIPNAPAVHSAGGYAGSIEDSHRNLIAEASDTFEAKILEVTNTMPGQTPVVRFEITNPQTGESYDFEE